MATRETVTIIIRADGSRTVIRELNDIGGAADRAGRSAGTLSKTLAAVAGGVVISKLRELSDEYTTIQNRLRLTTKDQGNLNAVFNELQRISTETRSALGPNVDLYSRLSSAAQQLGISQRDVLRFTESLNKAVKISGATAIEAENAIRQLTQGLGKGTLDGEELKSVLEQLPKVADVIAQGMGKVRGDLKELGAQGKITAAVVIDAFKKAGTSLDEDFAKITPTVTEGFVLLRNQLIETVGKINEVSGASTTAGAALKDLTTTIRDLTPGFINVARAVTGTLDPTDKLSNGMKVLATILVTTLGVLKLIAVIVKTVVFSAFAALGNLIGGLAASLGKFGEGLVETFQAVGGVLGSIGKAIGQAARGDFSEAGQTLSAAFTRPFEEAGKRFAESDAIFADAFKDSGKILADNFAEGDAALIDSASFTIEKLIQIFDSGARTIQDRKNDIVGEVEITKFKKRGGAGPTEEELKELEKLRNQLRGVLNEIAPLEGAILERDKALKTLISSENRGIISATQLAEFTGLLKERYRDILDPLGALNREMQQQADLLALDVRSRETQSQVLQVTADLLSKGVRLTESETQALREKIDALNTLNRVTQLQDSILEQTVGKREGFAEQAEALKNLLADPTSGFQQTDVTSILTDQFPGLLEGTQAMLDLQTEQYKEFYSNLKTLQDANVIDASTAAAIRTNIERQQNEVRLQQASGFFGSLSSLSRAGNQKIAKIGQAAAIAQATIDGVLAVQKALASAPPPANYALAAAAGVQAGVNVAQIASTSTAFATGGSFSVGGSGGTDSQQVSFRATPGERVQVSTPNQLRKGDPNRGDGAQPAAQQMPGISIINVRDPKEIPNAIQGSDGRDAIINVFSDNIGTFRELLRST